MPEKINVETDKSLGRYVTAAVNLKPGEIIFSEEPFAYGPKTDSPTVCLACYKYWNGQTLCGKCNWPVCGELCEKNPVHSLAECEIFAKAKAKFQVVEDVTIPCLQYDCITPLRTLLAKDANPGRWAAEVAPMEHHREAREAQKSQWDCENTNVVNYLIGPCKLGDKYSPELIHQVCGILAVNAFEAHSSQGGVAIRCLYPQLAILSHSCVSNIAHSIESTSGTDRLEIGNFKVVVRAATNIKQGEELNSSYTYSLWPTMIRRAFLRESKYFECACKRCSDPTELGTHMSTLKCSKCDNGIITSTNPLDDNSSWQCSHCSFTTRGQAVQQVFLTIQSDLDRVEADTEGEAALEGREALYRKYRSVLHPQNAYHTMLRVELAQLYGKVSGYAIGDLPDVLLERKIELCRQVLQNLDVIEPGYTRLRGLILYELHAPLMMLTRNLASIGVISNSDVKQKLNEVIKILEEATTILLLEPAGTVEGDLGSMSKESLKQLKENIDELVTAFN